MGKTDINREQIAQFMIKNKKQVIISGVLFAVGLIVLIVLLKLNYSFINRTQGKQVQRQAVSETADNPEPGDVSTYLPDTSRKMENSSELRDPFSRGMVLKGIITGGGSNLAIIESGSTAFVVGQGDKITGGWQLTEIERNAVILTMGIHKLRLEFNGRVKDLAPKSVTPKTSTGQPAAGTVDTGQASAGTPGENSGQALE